MSDKRQRPRIHRCDDKHDAALRAYARSRGIEPWEALEVAIERLKDDECDGTIDRLTKERDDAQTERECLATERDGAANALDEEIERSDKTTKRAYTLAERIGFVIDGLHKEAERADTAEDDLAAARKIAADLRAELASAREATRRADERIAELETALADWREASGERPAASKPARRRASESIACVLPRDLEKRASKLARARATTREQLINYCVTIGIKRLESVARHAPVQAAREKARRAAS